MELRIKGRPRVKYYNTEVKNIIREAQSYYKALIVTCTPFPTPSEAATSAQQAWMNACSDANIDLHLTMSMSRLVSSFFLHICMSLLMSTID
jgi:hypothetical protein